MGKSATILTLDLLLVSLSGEANSCRQYCLPLPPRLRRPVSAYSVIEWDGPEFYQNGHIEQTGGESIVALFHAN